MGRAVCCTDPGGQGLPVIFTETPLKGAYRIDIEKNQDERGFFARTWCENEFVAQGLTTQMKQCNISFNKDRGILRGLHYQEAPYGEIKIVRCTKGAIFDVIVDLRDDSDTFKQWYGVELNEENRSMLYIPEGFAHGFQTLMDESEVFYQMSQFYVPESARGVRWNDPAFGVEWPETEKRIMSERDQQYPDFAFSENQEQ